MSFLFIAFDLLIYHKILSDEFEFTCWLQERKIPGQ